MTHTEAYNQIEAQFSEVADQELIIDIIESQMIKKDIPFKRFYHVYQAKHLNKYGEYLQIKLND